MIRVLKTGQTTSWKKPQHPSTTVHLQGRMTEFGALSLMVFLDMPDRLLVKV